MSIHVYRDRSKENSKENNSIIATLTAVQASRVGARRVKPAQAVSTMVDGDDTKSNVTVPVVGKGKSNKFHVDAIDSDSSFCRYVQFRTHENRIRSLEVLDVLDDLEVLDVLEVLDGETGTSGTALTVDGVVGTGLKCCEASTAVCHAAKPSVSKRCMSGIVATNGGTNGETASSSISAYSLLSVNHFRRCWCLTTNALHFHSCSSSILLW